MGSKSMSRVAIIIVVVLIALVPTVSSTFGELAFAPSLSATPPPPPTPGPEPTLVPDDSQGVPVTTVSEALQLVLSLDSRSTIREQPLTVDVITANPDIVTVEQYTTRQEAAKIYGFGMSPDPEIQSEPVWVIIIKGKVIVNLIGRSVETDGVTYVISQKTGRLLVIGAGVIQKRK